jgi:uncharacterized protein (TIRG00374 family)
VRNPRVWIGIAVSALFLALLLRQVDRAELIAALREVRLSWLALAVVVELAALWVRGLRWREVLTPTVRISSTDAAALLLIGYAANNLLPMRAGEMVRAQLLHERHRASRLAALGTIVVERVFDGLTLALLLAATIALGGGDDTLRALAALMMAAFSGALLVLALLSWQPRFADWLISLLRVAPPAIRPRARALLGNFLGGLGALRGMRAWSTVAVLSAVTWALEAIAYWFVGEAFAFGISPWAYFGVCAAANLAIAVPSTAGGVGPFEFFARQVLIAFGVSSAAGTAYALVLHALVLVPVVLIGLALLWRHHLGIRSVLRAAEQEAVVGGEAMS